MAHFERVIVLIDMDCFYCQVEEQLNPAIAGKPVAVIQYSAWQAGGLIAVNYPARNCGVTRYMRGKEAKKVCPELILVSAPVTRGKSDITRYKDAGKRVAEVFITFTQMVERASVDEAYIDITELVENRLRSNYTIDTINFKNTHVVSCEIGEFLYSLDSNLNESNYRLALGAVIAEEIRAAVYDVTGYRCSAGIAHNKILAKLAAGMHKPNQQTILPHTSVADLYKTLPISKIRGLGAKFGVYVMDELNVKFMTDLYKFNEKELQQKFDTKTGTFLYNISRGIDNDPVTIRQKPKSVACSKNFAGPTALVNIKDVVQWVNDLSFILSERLTKDYDEYNRKAKNIVVIFTYVNDGNSITSSRTQPLNSYETNKVAEITLDVLNRNCIKDSDKFKIKHIGMSASKFEDCKSNMTLKAFFQNNIAKQKNNEQTQEIATCSKNNINAEIMSLIMEKKCSQQIVNDDMESKDLIYEVTTASVSDVASDLQHVNESLECHDTDCPFNVDKNSETSNNDSITNETFYENPLDESSFFNTYFKECDQQSSSVNRHFDTSRQLEDMDVSDDFTNTSISKELNPIINNNVENATSAKELCDECNKLIPVSEMLSHKDHHFALKLYKEDSIIHKTPNNNNKNKTINGKIDVKSKNKQKTKKLKNHVKLTSFLQHTPITSDGEPTEICMECGKNIPTKDWASHLDFHTAKKLHIELNRFHVQNTGTIKKSNTINSYFKPM